MSEGFALWAAGVALFSAAVALTRAGVVRAMIWLLVTLLSLAACFFALGAGFAGAVQILIYAGAILAVFIFVVMTVETSPQGLAAERASLRHAWVGPALAAAAVLAPLALGVAAEDSPAGVAVPVQAVGELLFGPWALAVEGASGLLLAALMGARHLGRRRKP
jgi:NADH-quinone oxidoreductase subunit J